MSRLKQLSNDSLIYGIGSVFAKGVSLFLLPIYTSIFTPAEYGTIEMLVVICSLISAILEMGMDSAQSMYFFKYKKELKIQVNIVSSIFQWRLIWGIVIISSATLLAPLFNAAFFGDVLSWEYFAVALFGTLFSQIMSQSAEILRLLYRPWSYIGITLAQSLLAASLILAAVLFFNQGIFGFFLGSAIGSFVAGLFGWFLVRKYINFDQLHYDWWPKLIRFGAPLMPAGLAMYFMNTSDRWFVQYYHGEAALGIYAVGAKFALLMALGVETFRKAWWPIAMDAMHSDDGPETFRLISKLYMSIGIAALIVLTLISPWLVRWTSAPAFHSSWPVVGILAWQSLFYGFFLISSAGIWKTEKTYLNFYMMMGSSILGILLNWLLVPQFGGVGAALSTAFTYLIWTLVSVLISEKLWFTGFPFKLFTFQIILAACMVAWYVATDINENTILKLITGSMAALLIFFSGVPIAFYMKLCKRLYRA